MRTQFPKITERRACGLLGIARSSCRYQAKKQLVNEEIEAELRMLASERPRFGYRRLHVLLRNARERNKQPSNFNAKRIHRLYKKAGLCLRRVVRKRLRRDAQPLIRLSGPNQEWALDFVHDSAGNGQKLRFLGVVDQFTRECLALVVDTALPSARVIRELAGVVARRGAPKRLRMDNGSELTSRRFLAWCVGNKIEMVHIQPGKPVQNAYSESFNGRIREEFLNVNWFPHLWDARARAAIWRQDYNYERPHSSLDYRTPAAFGMLWGVAPDGAGSAPSPGLTAYGDSATPAPSGARAIGNGVS